MLYEDLLDWLDEASAYDRFKNATEDAVALSLLVKDLVKKGEFKAGDLFPNPNRDLPFSVKLWDEAALVTIEAGEAFIDRKGKAHLNYGAVMTRWKDLVAGKYGTRPGRGLANVTKKDGTDDVVVGSMRDNVKAALANASMLMRNKEVGKDARSVGGRLMAGSRLAKKRAKSEAVDEWLEHGYVCFEEESAMNLYETMKRELGESGMYGWNSEVELDLAFNHTLATELSYIASEVARAQKKSKGEVPERIQISIDPRGITARFLSSYSEFEAIRKVASPLFQNLVGKYGWKFIAPEGKDDPFRVEF